MKLITNLITVALIGAAFYYVYLGDFPKAIWLYILAVLPVKFE